MHVSVVCADGVASCTDDYWQSGASAAAAAGPTAFFSSPLLPSPLLQAKEPLNAAPKGQGGKEAEPEELERQVKGGCRKAGMDGLLGCGKHGHVPAWLCCLPYALFPLARHPPLPVHRPASLPPLLPEQFWRNVTLNPPLYGADVPGSLFDPQCKVGAVCGGVGV